MAVEGHRWISDSNGPKPYDRGVFRCDPADITHPDKHTRLFNPEVESGIMIIQDGVILASHAAPASPLGTGIIVSLDMGKTWAQYDLTEFGRRSPCRFHRKNGEGWFPAGLEIRLGLARRDDVHQAQGIARREQAVRTLRLPGSTVRIGSQFTRC